MRRWLYVQLDAAAWQKAGLSPINRLVIFTIGIAVVTTVIETEPEIRTLYPRVFQVSDLIFGVLFSIEFLARVWVVGEKKNYAGLVGRVRFILSPTALIDLIAILPFFLTLGLRDAFILRLFRLLRLLTLAKLGRIPLPCATSM